MGTKESKMSEKDEKKQDLTTVRKENGRGHVEINQKTKTVVLDFDYAERDDGKVIDFYSHDGESVGSLLNSEEDSKILVKNGMSYSEVSISKEMAQDITNFLGV